MTVSTQLKWLATAIMLIWMIFAGLRPAAEPGLAARTVLERVKTISTATPLPAGSLCLANEHIIFSCTIKRSAKLVSLCASPGLSKDHGYLQYRFGLPGKVELEFPRDRQGSPQKFHYTHYFRFQVDLTEISFRIDDYKYTLFDDYNGEEKPAISSQGVSVTAPGKPKEVSLVCRAKPKADYAMLADVLGNDSQ